MINRQTKVDQQRKMSSIYILKIGRHTTDLGKKTAKILHVLFICWIKQAQNGNNRSFTFGEGCILGTC